MQLNRFSGQHSTHSAKRCLYVLVFILGNVLLSIFLDGLRVHSTHDLTGLPTIYYGTAPADSLDRYPYYIVDYY
jgi:hypothetical protein